jgi:hypothetical protein
MEAAQYSAEEIRRIRKGGAIAAAYLSLGEVREEPRLAAGQAAGVSGIALSPYYLDGDADGKPDRNASWGGLYVDARSPVWQERVLREMIPALIRKNANALFLDTLDTVDRFPETREGMVDLIRRIREAYPDLPLIANRGFSILEGTIPHLDAILFEAFSTRWDPASARSTLHPAADLEWVDAMLGKIRKIGGGKVPQVLVLDYASPKDAVVLNAAVSRARKAGLTYSITQGNLNVLPMEGGPAKPRKE